MPTSLLTLACALVLAQAPPAPEVLAREGALAVVSRAAADPGEPRTVRVELADPAHPDTPRVLLDRPVRSVSLARLSDLLQEGRPQVFFAWERPGTPPEVVALAVDAAGTPRVLLDVPARGFTLEDATGDGAPDLVVQASRGHPLAVAPVVYRAKGPALEETCEGTEPFYAKHLAALAKKIEAPPPPNADDSYANDRLVDMLDRGLTLELLGRRSEAFTNYQALLTRAALPTRLTRDQAASNAAAVDIVREARLSMAQLSGLRLVGQPRAK